MRKESSWWSRVVDNIWFWLVASNVIFLLVYLLWGVWNVLSVPAR